MSTQNDDKNAKQQPVWAVPAALGILLLSAGGFFYLLAQGIAVLSSVGY